MKYLIVVALMSLLHFSCAPSTPQARIDQNPAAFQQLGKKHQELVRQGRIAGGMSQDAVLLAWGSPDQRFQGYQNSRSTERWDYSASRPVYTNQFAGGFGGFGNCGRFGGFGRFGHPGFGDFGYMGFGPQITYVPYRVATVEFINNRVNSWEMGR
jgi:hypothetical protein